MAGRQRRKHHRPALLIRRRLIYRFVFGLFVALDLNRRAQAGRGVNQDEETLRAEYDAESTRQVELLVTREWVRSPEYVAVYAREEGGMAKPGEKRFVTLLAGDVQEGASSTQASADPAQYARPWQAWWQLLTEVPMPSG